MKKGMRMTGEHRWKFFKTASQRQVRIETGEDIAALAALDRRLYMALAMPIAAQALDARTLALMDTDGDGRIRIDELLAAVALLRERQVDLDTLFKDDPAVSARLGDVVRQLKDLSSAEPSAEDRAALSAWEARGRDDPALAPCGARTAAAEKALAAVEPVVDAFFAVPDDTPLVTDEADKVLPLNARLNPKWRAAVADLAREAVRPVLGRDEAAELSRADWEALKAAFAPYRAWQCAKPRPADAAVRALEDEERVCRYRLHLVAILRNFVNMADLYDPARTAIFQMGTLFIAGRSCTLCFHVSDEAAHAALAAKSDCCLVYAQLTRRGEAGSRTVCAVVTAGSTAPLYVGRNGVFYARDGRDYDAVVTRVIENQISLREAFTAPWRKIGETVSAQLKKFVGERQTCATAQVSQTLTQVPAPAGAAGGQSAALASAIAALGVGIGMMGAAFAGLIGLVAGLPWWKSACAVVVVILAVSVPSVILAWFKLRRRDLGAILNAGGWAVNRPVRFTTALARRFTRVVR